MSNLAVKYGYSAGIDGADDCLYDFQALVWLLYEIYKSLEKKFSIEFFFLFTFYLNKKKNSLQKI